jgi:hypothetical protein
MCSMINYLRVTMKMVQVRLGQILLEAIEYNQENEVGAGQNPGLI